MFLNSNLRIGREPNSSSDMAKEENMAGCFKVIIAEHTTLIIHFQPLGQSLFHGKYIGGNSPHLDFDPLKNIDFLELFPKSLTQNTQGIFLVRNPIGQFS